MNFLYRRFALTFALLLASTAAMAQSDVIGYVKTVQGEASVLSSGQALKAEPGTALKSTDVLKTGKQSSMGVTLKDNTRLSIGADTECALEEYLYDPAKDQLKLQLNLSRGTLNYVSGVIAKLKPNAVTIQTPTGNIGVRGTQFVAKVEPE